MKHEWLGRRLLPVVIATSLLIATTPALDGFAEPSGPAESSSASTGAQPETGATSEPMETAAGPAAGEATPEQLEQLVSPIALYPDLLVARILVASTFPEQIVEAHRWLQQNPKLKGDEFAKEVNAQPWDPSVRSLSQFPDVIKTMDNSLSWTSSLGEAYYNQPDDVMDAIQRLRNRAVKAGTLKDTPQQKIETKPATEQPAEGGVQQVVVIQPAQPSTVYVPQYDPSSVYGAPVQAPAGYAAPPTGYTGTEMLTTGLLSFGLGMGLMALINEDDDDWDCGWDGSGGNTVKYNKTVYRNRGNNYPRAGRSDVRQARRQGRNQATPYAGRGTRDPSSRPYNPSNAKPYRPRGPGGTPSFPKASTLPANARMEGVPGSASPRQGIANRPSSGPGRGIGAGNAQNLRGYGANAPNRATRGDRSGAFGGYGPGGMTQAAARRGRTSIGGGGGGFGGRGRAGRAGGGGRRGGGGGKGRR